MRQPPTLSILIPTHRPDRPLRRCLRSIASQPLLPGDEVIVIGDTYDHELPSVERLVKDFGPQYRYVAHNAGRHSHGHDQISHGMTLAKGAWLLYQDDDDAYLEGAFAAVRRAAASLPEPRPMMFRFIPWFRVLLWATKEIAPDRIGGHNFVPPNIPARLAPWGAHYQGDYSHVRDTVDLWPNKDADVCWFEDVLTLARPDQ